MVDLFLISTTTLSAASISLQEEEKQRNE